MSVATSVVFATARTLLNDDAGVLWTDGVLFPKLTEAHRELQKKLKLAGSPVMRGEVTISNVPAASVLLTLPADFVEPIRLWDSPTGGASTTRVPMTESDPLPFIASPTSIQYWQWAKENVNILSAPAGRDVFMLYWRSIPIPVLSADAIGVIDGELFLSPRTAALAAGSVGEEKRFTAMTQIAEASLDQILKANRGRAGGPRP